MSPPLIFLAPPPLPGPLDVLFLAVILAGGKSATMILKHPIEALRTLGFVNCVLIQTLFCELVVLFIHGFVNC